MSFDFKFAWRGSEDSFELWIDGLAVEIAYVHDLAEAGSIRWTMPAGAKQVVIYLPADATVVVKNFTVNGDVAPVKKGKKVLWLGDSITQGYGPLRSAHTYVSVANRLLNYDIINQGIGGYIYDKKSLMKMDGYQPEMLIVALGTNQYGMKDMTMVEEYYETLMGIYGTEIPVLVISPIWRPPQTTQGTMPIPFGKTTAHSVIISKISLVNTLPSSGSTNVSATILAGWQ